MTFTIEEIEKAYDKMLESLGHVRTESTDDVWKHLVIQLGITAAARQTNAQQSATRLEPEPQSDNGTAPVLDPNGSQK